MEIKMARKYARRAKKDLGRCLMNIGLCFAALVYAASDFVLETLAGKLFLGAGVFMFLTGISVALSYSECAGCCLIAALFSFVAAAADLKHPLD